MADRTRPIGQFNFHVTIPEGQGADTELGGFQDVSGLGVEVTATDYRNGNDKNNSPMKISTLYKVPDITLKRGVCGAKDLFEWIKETREGKDKRKTITIVLEDENHKKVLTWTLKEARPVKWTGPTLSGKGTEVAIEELVLACEQIEME